MGDNRTDSADSRLHDCAYTYTPAKCVPYDRGGTIPEDKVIGRAFMIVWPPSRIRILPIPATFGRSGLSHGSALPAGSGRQVVAGAIPVRPSAPYLPLAGGLAAAVPLTMVERRLRLRLRGRRRSGGMRRGRRGPRRG
jgi:signal peptidase I